MKDCYVTEVIICTLERRGNGNTTPIRSIKQVFEKDGTLISEYDPEMYSIEEIDRFGHWAARQRQNMVPIIEINFKNYLKQKSA